MRINLVLEVLQLTNLPLDRLDIGSKRPKRSKLVFCLIQEQEQVLQSVVELHCLLHGVNKVLLSFGVQGSDVIPCGIEIFHVLLHFRFVRLSADLHQLLPGLAARIHFRFGLVDFVLDLLKSDLLLLDDGGLDCRRFLRRERVLKLTKGGHDAVKLVPEALGDLERLVERLASVAGRLLDFIPQAVQSLQLTFDV